MKKLKKFIEATFLSVLACTLLDGCAQNIEGKAAKHTFIPGPIIYGGVEYYPSKPGATYHNTPVDYTTNKPPSGAYTFVTLISTNGIVIRPLAAKNSTNIVTIPYLR